MSIFIAMILLFAFAGTALAVKNTNQIQLANKRSERIGKMLL